jgi:mono/diheme cytochrome c family protein
MRRGLGLWQRLYVDGETFVPDPKASAEVNRGAYLVEGPGHCVECHSPRNVLGGITRSQAFAGARNPEGKGTIPNITPSDDGIGDWTLEDIAYLLETGNTPDFDVIGGNMAAVQENMAKLRPQDRQAIAAYLKTLTPLPDAVPKSEQKEEKDDGAEAGGGEAAPGDASAKKPQDDTDY